MTGEKTEQPTEQRLKESRQKGQVPQRKNVLEAFTLCLASIYVFSNWRSFAEGFSGAFELGLSELHVPLADKYAQVLVAFTDALKFGFVLTAILALVGLFFHLAISGFNFAPKSLQPKFEKLNPVTGFKNIFSKATLYNFIRLMIYFPAVSFIFTLVVISYFEEIIEASMCGINCIAEVLVTVFFLTIIAILILLIILAAFDFRIQTAIFISQSKMTKDEVKREYKGNEGDPLIKSARRQIALDDAHMPTMDDITHVVYSSGYLVALIYHNSGAPFVVMRSKGDAVKRTLALLRPRSAKCVNLPQIAREFYTRSTIGAYLDKSCIPGMEKVLEESQK